MNTIFAGTAEFALPSLKTLLEHHTVLAVITAPDKPKGRGQKIKPSPIKEMILEYCKKAPPLVPPLRKGGRGGVIPIFTKPINQLAPQIKHLNPDIIVVAAYGQLLGKKILAIPRFGCWNVHPSLLPKYRGASPIQTALLNGDKETGVTIIQMNKKLDAGAIIAQEKVKIAQDETAGSLHDTLSWKGAELLQRTLEDFKFSKDLKSLYPIPQNHSQATYTKKITARDAELDLKKPAYILERMVRAYNPFPGAYIRVKSEKLKVKSLRLKIWAAEIKKDADVSLAIQTSFKNISLYQKCPAIVCGDGKLLFLAEVQPEGKKRMSGEEFARGYFIHSIGKSH